ncbi:MAG: alpha-glucuronidase [Chitinophagaceae bacterium]|nr:alpha-glucuronidase [Chitinophagaceae bacterium]
MKNFLPVFCFLILSACCHAQAGYHLWLNYNYINNPTLSKQYRELTSAVYLPGHSPTLDAVRYELNKAIPAMLGSNVLYTRDIRSAGVIFTKNLSEKSDQVPCSLPFEALNEEGYFIRYCGASGKPKIIIGAKSDIGLLYGAFGLLRMMQLHFAPQKMNTTTSPAVKLRLLNHWDNLNRTVERGYAGFSIWNWHTLPEYRDPRYTDYARANASIGINGTVLTNVNANATVLTREWLLKVKTLADLFRPYGIKVYLTARFSAPIEIGKLKTADPLSDSVKNWWKEKVREIYALIPDFGGFLVKANSEGQPGPQDYNRSHADGANMLADALAPHGGIVMWRAFVYRPDITDRFRAAYDEFKPLDGKFRDNVLIQVKNGPIDFQPREPFSPLFGAMPQTNMMMEFQITQEYVGQATHLFFVAPWYKEVLDADTYAKGKGSTVSKVVDGSLYGKTLTGVAGVSNIGNDINWCGHPFAQANWYAFGRLAWNATLPAGEIAEEWIKQTLTHESLAVQRIKHIMLHSTEALINYMTPIGLTHIMQDGHHYGPMPWGNSFQRADWNPVYYHRADTNGIGFDRTEKGSNALSQYFTEVKQLFENPATCPDEYLLWFHRVPWHHKMKSGRTVWEELCYRYYTGVDSVRSFIKLWRSVEKWIQPAIYRQVSDLLERQLYEALWWRDACILYFQTFSKMPIPKPYEAPKQTLEYFKNLKINYAPGHW